MSAKLPLFAFGTLRSGQCHHELLRGRYERRLQGLLFGYGRIGPLMIDRRDGQCVEGEVFFLPAEHYDAVLADCDKLEGIPPGQTRGRDYARVEVSVNTSEGVVTAWAYVRPDATTSP